ncbi:Sigma-54 interaction domain-containing protein [Dyadobacter sp. SG02]|uniref:sigma-54 interaction domain-containing protein n=1 Tax=Dyadobacter sp. SG02 TaxID=1855291 RepID=UPI0008CB2B1B|nr:sigma 54-interacting transcriptional regulator [Dyadobacter sp. SG02]SEI53375.1 Sigma-54 interaction domain-containing protein [Dyadobacter sp. SG02]
MSTPADFDQKIQELRIRLAASGLFPSPEQGSSSESSLDWLIRIAGRLCEQLERVQEFKGQLEEQHSYLLEEVKEGFSYNDIIGSSDAMQTVFHLLSQVSSTNSTVLLLGETGTGKELFARAIHNSSGRQHHLMVKVNCAALPAELVESELFGHEKGSFTGAVQRRIGKFELANKGTLFLDEIGELSPDMQAKLLRAIQEREIERIGGKESITVDVRIIAATNRNLYDEVQHGRFRSDLFYRLNVFPIYLPPLRERRDDIVLLAKHFVARNATNSGKKISRISSNVIKQLLAYPWPGNVRELEHQMERSVLMAKGNIITDVHLPASGGPLHPPAPSLYDKTHAENEKDYIIQILNKCNGKVYGPGGAAQILGLKVGTLNSKIKKLGINKELVLDKGR